MAVCVCFHKYSTHLENIYDLFFPKQNRILTKNIIGVPVEVCPSILRLQYFKVVNMSVDLNWSMLSNLFVCSAYYNDLKILINMRNHRNVFILIHRLYSQ